MWLPKPLYEILPYLYVAVGLAAVVAAAFLGQALPGATAVFLAGLAFAALGIAIWMKRRSERLSVASRRRRERELFRGGPD